MAEKIAGYRAEGYTKFQLKVGGDANDDIARIKACRAISNPTDILVADANTGWTKADAARVVNAVRDLDVYIEQPCMSYEESVSIRRRTSLPFVLDENIGSAEDLVQGIADDAFDVINLKISKVGGLTKAKLMRDLCVAHGIPMTIEDTWGGDIVTATIAHLARSTPEKFCFTATDFNSYVTVSIADGAPKRDQRHHDHNGNARPRHRAEIRRPGRAGAGGQLRSSRAIEIVACHAEGEVGDVIVGGVAPPPGETIWEQSRFIARDGSLRNLLLNEPRGGVYRHINLLVPPKNPKAQMGFIIMEPEDTPPMSGSNSICVATVLLDTGIVPMTEPETRLVLEAPGGLVEIVAQCRNGKAERIYRHQRAFLRRQARRSTRSRRTSAR